MYDLLFSFTFNKNFRRGKKPFWCSRTNTSSKAKINIRKPSKPH